MTPEIRKRVRHSARPPTREWRRELDSPCSRRCRCSYGSAVDCTPQCPPLQPCEEYGFCERGRRTACGTDDAGCSRECDCFSYVATRQARCVTRCGGAAFACSPALYVTPDAGCADSVSCTFSGRNCQCAPDAGWSPSLPELVMLVRRAPGRDEMLDLVLRALTLVAN